MGHLASVTVRRSMGSLRTSLCQPLRFPRAANRARYCDGCERCSRVSRMFCTTRLREVVGPGRRAIDSACHASKVRQTYAAGGAERDGVRADVDGLIFMRHDLRLVIREAAV